MVELIKGMKLSSWIKLKMYKKTNERLYSINSLRVSKERMCSIRNVLNKSCVKYDYGLTVPSLKMIIRGLTFNQSLY
jgi:hypothetical protein